MARTIKLRMKRPAKSQSSQYTSPTLEWAKVVAIPLTGAFVAAGVAFWSADLTSDRASDAAYVQLAITTLSRELPETSDSDQTRSAEIALRQWATEVLSRTGPVPLPDEAAAALIGGEISIASEAQERARELAERCDAERTGTSGIPTGDGPVAIATCELADAAARYAYDELLRQADEERLREKARRTEP